MEIISNSLILLLSIFALWIGAVWIVDSASRIAHHLGISELVIGLTVVAFGTSAPEFAVTLSAAFRGQADISAGNVVGSNVFNLGLILGGVAAFQAIKTSAKLVYRDGLILIGSSILLLVFMWDLTLTSWEGFVLVSLLIAYLLLLFFKKEKIEDDVPLGKFHWYDVLKFLAGLTFILFGGHYLVSSASALARNMGITEWVIAVTIVAAGTSTPELATSMVALVKGKHGISAGNLIGSNLFNLLGVLGLAALLNPLHVDSDAYREVFLLLGLVLVVVIMMRSGWKISRFEGIVLVSINLIWLIRVFWG